MLCSRRGDFINAPDPDYDWLRFWIHFVFGALLGGLLGVSVWLHHWQTGQSPLLWIGGFSLVVALLGGIYGDRFWECFLRSLSWWRF